MYFHNVIAGLLFNSVPNAEQAEYSCPTWKRVPTTLEVIFGFALPYRPPKSPVGAFLWRKRVWFESTFALTMLQPWEKLILLIVLHSTWILLLTAFFLYFPHHYAYLQERWSYYLWGEETESLVSSVTQTVAQLNTSSTHLRLDL